MKNLSDKLTELLEYQERRGLVPVHIEQSCEQTTIEW